MSTPTLPEGARLALLNWPGGQPTVGEIIEAIAPGEPLPSVNDEFVIISALVAAGLIEEVDVPKGHMRTFRLTQAGRKAMDVLQSEVE